MIRELSQDPLLAGMSERELKIRKRFSDDMDPDYDDARYLIGVIDTIRWDRKLLRDAAEREPHVSHCQHCEQRHSGSCQDLGRNVPVVGIDV